MSESPSRMPLENLDSLRERFAAKHHHPEGDCCWIWNAAWRGNGYGCIKVQSVLIDSHVLSWRLANNGAPVPEGHRVCHHCDVRPCVRPDHLFVGTNSDNMQDAARKGRLDESRVRGSQTKNAVLTEAIVIEARRLRDEAGMTGRRIAEHLGVPYSSLSMALCGASWKHV